MTVRLAKTSKMPCKSWSLQALDTCPGSKSADGTLVAACSGCYATTGRYLMPNAIEPRTFNREDWKRPEWASEMIAAIGKAKYFRWFDSGDCYDLRLAEKILQVMQGTPSCQHWMPTRMYKFRKFRAVFAAMESLPNVVVRYSSDGINGELVRDARNSSTIVPSVEAAPLRTTVCHAYERDGKCGDCRACWNKEVSIIAYPAQGAKMHKIIAKSA